jgi:hypothetical protein
MLASSSLMLGEEFLQRIQRSEGRDVLLVKHHAADPDGGLGESGAAVAGEGILEDDGVFVFSESFERGSEGDGRVVRRNVVAAQAIDDEDEDVGFAAG